MVMAWDSRKAQHLSAVWKEGVLESVLLWRRQAALTRGIKSGLPTLRWRRLVIANSCLKCFHEERELVSTTTSVFSSGVGCGENEVG